MTPQTCNVNNNGALLRTKPSEALKQLDIDRL